MEETLVLTTYFSSYGIHYCIYLINTFNLRYMFCATRHIVANNAVIGFDLMRLTV